MEEGKLYDAEVNGNRIKVFHKYFPGQAPRVKDRVTNTWVKVTDDLRLEEFKKLKKELEIIIVELAEDK